MTLTELLDRYSPTDLREQDYLAQMRMLALEGDAALRRDHFDPGHFTASAFVLSPDGRNIALILHPKLRRWLQPGGHLELEDAGPLQATLREVAEEIGLSELEPLGEGLFDIDVHEIPKTFREPAHQHFDLRFAFTSRALQLDGEHEARWVRLEHVNEIGSDASVTRAVGKLLRRPR